MNRIKELRQKNKLSQIELANKVHASNQAISAYESGTREPKEPMWQALANFFDVSVPYLKGYMVCTRCKGYFIPKDDAVRENIKCCPYCMNPYFEGDK
ncbi:helix-turn-helix domain-containing protein [Lactobacillus helveticus]|uniref:helix-turn-helix domain-containing protein n=1 Tax=Lactobacillus helveticus TaxID=1587 RepID=UPI0021AD374C|nr:helix-turn-helix transcriptional regulator [Lactobacillus helveticus]